MKPNEFSQHERDVLANLVMRSLRGSWAAPYEERAEFLIELADAGLSDYDAERVKRKAKAFLENRDGYRDGRTFRYIYEGGPTLAEQTDEKTAKSLVGHIPVGDHTWSSNAIERRFGKE